MFVRSTTAGGTFQKICADDRQALIVDGSTSRHGGMD
jgi:hypothetical protein